MSLLLLILLILSWRSSRTAAFYILDGWIWLNWSSRKLIQKKIIRFTWWPKDKWHTDIVDIMVMNKMNKKHHNSVTTDWEHWYFPTTRLVGWSEIQIMNAIISQPMFCFCFLFFLPNDDALGGTRDLINQSPWERKTSDRFHLLKKGGIW